MAKVLRIGNSSGFWGDEPHALRRQLKLGKLHYVVADYLAEVSMSILHKQQKRDPDLGYVSDFIEHVGIGLEYLENQKIITNAGGNNPIGCALELQKLLSVNNIDKKVIAVVGDDLMNNVLSLSKSNSFSHLDTGVLFNEVGNKLVAANAYTSSEGIVKALKYGADIVITGRASDSALTIGPLIYEFAWETNDWNKIASAMIAGHILECGSQATGGNFSDWELVSSWDDFGFPIVEINEDAQILVSKPGNTGGLVSVNTIREQLIYEVGNPKAYLGPDVIADMSEIELEELSDNKVKVSGVKGIPPPDTWKVSMAYHHGYKASGSIMVGGDQSLEKCKVIIEAFWKRLGLDFEKTQVNRIGIDSLGKALKSESNEVLLQFVAFDSDKSKLVKFAKEVSGLILSSPQGISAATSRPRVQDVIAYWPTLVNKADLKMDLYEVYEKDSKLIDSFTPIDHVERAETDFPSESFEPSQIDILIADVQSIEVKMKELCLVRSGDKGNNANIGILPRTKDIYQFMKKNLTEKVISGWFNDLGVTQVDKYSLDNMMGLNYVLHNVLDGGGTVSGRIDSQGKMLAAAVLSQKVWVPQYVYDSIQK
ncbi:acyclic terpene utilization AtuA family protein [Reichenbachiella versicolor]|uniref:acyclic terpene utilization AtuA family protein n=1 Tax=Reichenbachiella versicolor TaxID=1821036 RepID=UPI000D6E886B|nr:acyclic terpene utilization AtuA family protein [Reichenbachiella versicolor]